MNVKLARKLYFDSARFWLHNVKQLDRQTIEDVLALLDWPEQRQHIEWSAKFGRGQVFTSAIMNSGIMLTDLKSREVLP